MRAAGAALLALAAAAVALPLPTTALEHGWGCVLGCGGVSMLGADFATTRFSLDDPWWLDAIAASYGAVVVHELAVMSALKRRDPNIKTLLYQPIDRAGDSDLILGQLKAHPDWLVRDDQGMVVNFKNHQGHPMPNYTIPECQDWYANLAISMFSNHSEAALLLDGILLDGDGYHSYANVSHPRAEALYKGMIETTRKMQAKIDALNGHSEVLINAGMWCDGPDNDTNASGAINQLACRSPMPMIDAGSGSFDEVRHPAVPLPCPAAQARVLTKARLTLAAIADVRLILDNGGHVRWHRLHRGVGCGQDADQLRHHHELHQCRENSVYPRVSRPSWHDGRERRDVPNPWQHQRWQREQLPRSPVGGA